MYYYYNTNNDFICLSVCLEVKCDSQVKVKKFFQHYGKQLIQNKSISRLSCSTTLHVLNLNLLNTGCTCQTHAWLNALDSLTAGLKPHKYAWKSNKMQISIKIRKLWREWKYMCKKTYQLNFYMRRLTMNE